MSQNMEQQVRATLHAVANQVDAKKDWGRVVGDAQTSNWRPSGRTAFAGIVAPLSVLLILGSWLVISRSSVTPVANGASITSETTVKAETTEKTSDSESFVLSGEVVLLEDPLVVIAAPSPEPQFDTAPFGTEVKPDQPENVEDLPKSLDDLNGDVVALIEQHMDSLEPDAEVRKIILYGRFNGEPIVGVLSEEPQGQSIFRQFSTITATASSGRGALVEPGSRELIDPPVGVFEAVSPFASWGGTPEKPGAAGDLSVPWQNLPADVSIVSLEVSGEGYWTRPQAGYASFVVPIKSGTTTFTIEALDTDGNVLASKTGEIPSPGG